VKNHCRTLWVEKGIVDYHPPKIPNNPQKQWVEHRTRSKIMSFMICLKKPLAQHGVNHWRTSWIQNRSFDHQIGITQHAIISQKTFSKKAVYKTSLSPKNILQENGHLPGPETSINQLHSATRKGVVKIRPNLWIFNRSYGQGDAWTNYLHKVGWH
jgi:hypothetical protein